MHINCVVTRIAKIPLHTAEISSMTPQSHSRAPFLRKFHAADEFSRVTANVIAAGFAGLLYAIIISRVNGGRFLFKLA